MQSDLHYYGIAFLAKAAGFSSEEVEIIAYSSQYVDDSTEGSPIHVGDHLFNPVRTAHYSLKAFTWSVQSKVYIPFHFLPPSPRRCNLVTKEYPEASMAKLIFNRACEETDTKLRLVRLGVALHTVADTYSHQGFSGRNSNENRLSSCSVINKELTRIANFTETLKRLSGLVWQKLKSFIMPVVPPIGHAQAINNPDLPYLKWSYTYYEKELSFQRDNTEVFMKGCKQIYELLCEAIQPKKRKNAVKDPKRIDPLKTWDEISSNIDKCLKSSIYSSCNNKKIEDDELFRGECWQRQYKECFGEEIKPYDKYLWRTLALQPANPEHVKWDLLSKDEISKYRFNHNPKFFSSYWVKFHRAAMTQRYLVFYHLL